MKAFPRRTVSCRPTARREVTRWSTSMIAMPSTTHWTPSVPGDPARCQCPHLRLLPECQRTPGVCTLAEQCASRRGGLALPGQRSPWLLADRDQSTDLRPARPARPGLSLIHRAHVSYTHLRAH